MDKNVLKQYISSRVYENTAGLVTGEGNQEALLAIVDDCYNGPATASVLGSVKVGSGLSVTSDGTLSYALPTAGVGVLGGIRLASASILSNGTLGVATTVALGLVKADGSTTTVDGDGTIHAVGGGGGGGMTRVYHDDSLVGTGVDDNNKLSVATSGTGTGLSLSSTNGPLKVNVDGTTMTINGNNELVSTATAVPLASSSTIGGALVSQSIYGPSYQPSVYGVGLRISIMLMKVPNALYLEPATPTTIGGIALGEGLVNNSFNNGSYDTPVAEVDLPRTDTAVNPVTRKIGGVRLANPVQSSEASLLAEGSTPNRNYPLSLDSRGVAYVNVPWQNVTTDVPHASTTVYGTVKIGTGIAVNDGTISVTGGGSYTLPTAKTSELGGVMVTSGNDTGYAVNATTGELTLTKATTSLFGVAKAGNGLTAAAGVLSVLLRADSGLTLNSSGLALDAAGLSYLGGIKVAAESAERGYEWDGTGLLEMRTPTDVQAGVMMLSKGLTTYDSPAAVGLNLATNSGLEFEAIPGYSNDYVKIKASTGLALGSGGLSLAKATTSTLGGVIPDGSTITIDSSGVIHATGGGGGGGLSVVTHDFTLTGTGEVASPLGVRLRDVGDELTGLTQTTPGNFLAVNIGDGLELDNNNRVKAKVDGTTVTINSNGELVASGGGSGGLSAVSHTTSFTGNGTSSSPLALAPATAALLGGVKVDGTTITASNGVISAVGSVVPAASESTLGGFKVDTIDETTTSEQATVYVRGYDMGDNPPGDYDSILKLRLATDDTFGIMMYSSVDPIYRASDGTARLRYKTDEFDIESGYELSLRPATNSSLGGVMVNSLYETNVPSFLKVDSVGRIGVAYDSRVLTPYGGSGGLSVKTGDGLSIDANGLVLDVASSSALGGVKIDNSTIKMNASNQLYSTVSGGLSAVTTNGTLTGDGTSGSALGVKVYVSGNELTGIRLTQTTGLIAINPGSGFWIDDTNKLRLTIDDSLAINAYKQLGVAMRASNGDLTGLTMNSEGKVAVQVAGTLGLGIDGTTNEVGILSGNGPTDSTTTTGTYIPTSGPTTGMLQVSLGSGLQFGTDGSPANRINVDGSAIAGTGLRGNSVDQHVVELALPAQTTTGDFFAIQKQSNGSFTWVSLGALDAILDQILGN